MATRRSCTIFSSTSSEKRTTLAGRLGVQRADLLAHRCGKVRGIGQRVDMQRARGRQRIALARRQVDGVGYGIADAIVFRIRDDTDNLHVRRTAESDVSSDRVPAAEELAGDGLFNTR